MQLVLELMRLCSECWINGGGGRLEIRYVMLADELREEEDGSLFKFVAAVLRVQ